MSARPALRLHRHPLSGHCHRVELLLSLLGLPFERMHVDLAARAQKTPAFLRLNPFGQIPVLEDDGIVIADSNAILVYLALTYDRARVWYPAEPAAAAQVQRWLSVAAGPLAAGPAAARIAAVFGRKLDIDGARAIAGQLFGVLDAHLAVTPFLVGPRPTIADLALYAYTAHAPEGGIALESWPQVTAWLRRVEALPGFVPMQAAPAPAAA